jgi:hypothetical protein
LSLLNIKDMIDKNKKKSISISPILTYINYDDKNYNRNSISSITSTSSSGSCSSTTNNNNNTNNDRTSSKSYLKRFINLNDNNDSDFEYY